MNPVPSGDHHPLTLDGDRELTTAYFKGQTVFVLGGSASSGSRSPKKAEYKVDADDPTMRRKKGTVHCWEFEGPTAPTEGFSRRRTEGEQKEVCNRRRKTAFVPEVDDPEDAPKRPKRVFPLQHHCRRSRRSGKIRKQNS